MKIAVMYGGISSEREVSINTGKEIISNLDKSKYEVIGLELEKAEDIFKLKDMDVDFYGEISMTGNRGSQTLSNISLSLLII